MRALPLALCLLTLPLAAAAQDVKTAVVDVDKVMNSTDHWKSAANALEADRKLRQSTLETKQKELRERKEKLDAKKAVSAANSTLKEDEELAKDAQQLAQAFMAQQQELSAWEKRITEAMLERVELVVREVALVGDYDFVFEVGPPQTPNVLYNDKKIDITPKIIETYQKRYKDKPLDIKKPAGMK